MNVNEYTEIFEVLHSHLKDCFNDYFGSPTKVEIEIIPFLLVLSFELSDYKDEIESTFMLICGRSEYRKIDNTTFEINFENKMYMVKIENEVKVVNKILMKKISPIYEEFESKIKELYPYSESESKIDFLNRLKKSV